MGLGAGEEVEAAGEPPQDEGADLHEFAYYVPEEKFIYKTDGEWRLHEKVGKEGLVNHLTTRGWDIPLIQATLKNRAYLKVHGHDLIPNMPPIFSRGGANIINTWSPPQLAAVEGEYPTIQAILDWVTRGDLEGQRWVKHWMAAKVQQPLRVPKIAVVLATAQGGGKGILAVIMRHMLGLKNTAVIKQEEIENRFNARWVGKLFVLGDEVLSNESLRDISNKLKVLIDGNELEYEGKHQNQTVITSKLAWMFASNDKISPLVLEDSDRRYTVFANHSPLPDEYRAKLVGSFTPEDREKPTDAFRREMEAFHYEMLHTKVDWAFISRPYENASRKELIVANLPAQDLFFKQVEEEGINELLALVKRKDWTLEKDEKDWDFGEEGLDKRIVYACYKEFCKQSGARYLKPNKFGSAVKHHEPAWEQVRKTKKDGKQVRCWVVPRTGKGLEK